MNDMKYENLSMGEYLALPYVSASLLHNVLAYSPAHAKFWQQNRDDASEASDTGTAIHDALLEGMDRIVAIDAPDWRTKAAKEARDVARLDGKIPMLAHKVKNVEGAVNAAHKFIGASPLAGIFTSGKPEQTLIWEEGGLRCKARPDWLTNDRDILLHLKTTKGSANPEVWIRSQLEPMGYDVALAWYQRAIEQFVDADSCEHVVLVVEQEAPHGCSLISLDPAMWSIAHAKVARALATWQRCVAAGRFPAYPSAIHYAEPKPWQLAQEEEAQLGVVFDQLQEEQGLQA
jgi:hypothetical protein